MKKHFLVFLFLFSCFIGSFYSCEQCDINDVANQKIETISFKYRGRFYTYSNTTLEGGVYCSNPRVDKLHLEILSNPNLATLIDERGNIEYFDSYDELQNYIENGEQPIQGNLLNGVMPNKIDRLTINLYINVKYKGGGKILTVKPDMGGVIGASYISDLSTIGLLNRISSLKMTQEVASQPHETKVTLWDQKNFKGRSVTWRIPGNYVELASNPILVPNLYNVKRGNEGLHWNDAAQSMKFGYTKYNGEL